MMDRIYTPRREVVPAIVRQDYVLGLEHHQDPHDKVWRIFVHCVVDGLWSHGVYKRLRTDFTVLHSLIDAPLFALHTPGDVPHSKFLRAGGFSPVHETWCDIDGNPRELYVREKDIPNGQPHWIKPEIVF